MEETKLIANLPRLDVEVVHVQDPEERAEVVTIKMTANPSFNAFGDYLTKGLANPLTLMWAAPFGLWSGMVEAAWRPWLSALTPRLPKSDAEGDSPRITDKR